LCGGQPVAFMISANVALVTRFISAITSAFLFRSLRLGSAGGLLGRPAFFAALAFSAHGLRLAFAGIGELTCSSWLSADH